MVYVSLNVKAGSCKSTQSISLPVDLVDSTHGVLQAGVSSLCPLFELTGSHMSVVFMEEKSNPRT